MQDDWGYVCIQPNKSAPETLKSIQDLKCQLRIDSGKPSEAIASIHHVTISHLGAR
jgi:hypothetical protein